MILVRIPHQALHGGVILIHLALAGSWAVAVLLNTSVRQLAGEFNRSRSEEGDTGSHASRPL